MTVIKNRLMHAHQGIVDFHLTNYQRQWQFDPKFPLNQISTQGGFLTSQQWIEWLAEEDPIHRFGDDVQESYYVDLENWWELQLKSPHECIEPVVGWFNGSQLIVIDGHHRTAMSHKLKFRTQPTILIGTVIDD